MANSPMGELDQRGGGDEQRMESVHATLPT